MGLDITWYDVLGALPGASAEEIQREYDSKASLLRPELIAGAPSTVVTAVSRAQGILDSAWRVVGDPVRRKGYDEDVGLRRSGGGLARPESFPSEPGWRSSDFDFVAGRPGAELLSGLMALTDWLTPHPREPRRIIVPDIRGLFYSVCLEIVGKLHLRVTAVRLTKYPMPVDGLVVDQFPRPPAKMHREVSSRLRYGIRPSRPRTYDEPLPDHLIRRLCHAHPPPAHLTADLPRYYSLVRSRRQR